MNLILVLLLSLQGSVHVGKDYSQIDIAKAKAILAASEPKELRMKVGEFEIIEPSKDAKPLQFFQLTNACVEVVEIRANEAFAWHGVRRGESVGRLHRFDARAYRWAIVYAKAQGREAVIVNRNGADPAKDAPEVVEKVLAVVGDVQPVPPGPNPPTPPTPTDTWSKDGLRVLILFESMNNPMTSAQVAAINSVNTRNYLNEKCIKVNGQPEWRVWDKDTDISRESDVWKDGIERWKKAGSRIPFMMVSNGKSVDYVGELPANIEKMAELLKKYGDQ